MQTALDTIQNDSQDVAGWGQKLGMLEQWSRTAAQVDKTVAKLDADLAKAKARRDAANYPGVIAKVASQIDEVKSAWTALKTSAAGGDIENIQSDLQDLYGQITDAQHAIQFIGQLSGVAKMAASADKDIAAFSKNVDRLEKKGTNVSALREAITAAKAKLDALKALSGRSDATPDDFFAAMQELDDAKQNAIDEYNAATGQPASANLGAAVFQAFETKRLGF